MANSTKGSRYLIQRRLLVLGFFLLIASIVLSSLGFLRIELYQQVILESNRLRSLVDLDLYGQTVLGGYDDNHIRLYDKQGSLIWEAQLPNAPVVITNSNKGIFVSDESRAVSVFSHESNQKLHNFTVPFRPISVSGDLESRRVLVGSTLTAFRNEVRLSDFEGNLLFAFDPEEVIVQVYYQPATRTSFILTRSGTVSAYGHQGELLHAYRMGNYPIAMAVQGEYLVVADELNTLHLLNSTNLQPLWKTQVPNRISSLGFSHEDGSLILGTMEGNLVSVNPEGSILWTASVGEPVSKAWGGSEVHDLYVVTAEGTMLRALSDDVKSYSVSIMRQNTMRTSGFSLGGVSLLVFLGLLVFTGVSGDKKSLLYRIYKSRQSYFLLIPTVGLLLVFNYYPAVSALVMAFADYLPGSHFRWVGFNNFILLVNNEYFWFGMRNMLIFLVTDMMKFLIPPIITAELIFAVRNSTMKYWIRVLFYLPAVLPGVAGLLVWTQGMLGVDGAVNGFLEFVGLGHLAQPWLANPDTALAAIVFMGFPWVGTFYIIFFGALISIPDSLFDAAKIDGCGWLRRIWVIDLPHISPQIKFVMVTGFIASVQDFQRVFVTTMGGPGHATYTPMLELYFQMSRFHNYGLASAMGVVLFLVLFSGTLINLRLRLTKNV